MSVIGLAIALAASTEASLLDFQHASTQRVGACVRIAYIGRSSDAPSITKLAYAYCAQPVNGAREFVGVETSRNDCRTGEVHVQVEEWRDGVYQPASRLIEAPMDFAAMGVVDDPDAPGLFASERRRRAYHRRSIRRGSICEGDMNWGGLAWEDAIQDARARASALGVFPYPVAPPE